MTTEATTIMQPAMVADFWGQIVIAERGSVSFTGSTLPIKRLNAADLDAYAAILAEAREFAFGPVPEVAP